MERESMEFDVVIVGAGPAGLSTAIRLKQLSESLNICVLEKGSEVGAHILSGAVLETRALDELIPDWKEKDAPIKTAATEDHFLLLTKHKSYSLPTPPGMKNHGNYIVSLGRVVRWLGEVAEGMGIEIFPGFTGKDIVQDDTGRVTGILTGDFGLSKEGQPTDKYQPGMILYGKQIILSEGCRGSLSEKIINTFDLRKGKSPQTYGIGIKELWQIDKSKHNAGTILHSVGWPLDNHTYGGSFIYHFDEDLVSLGFVIGLDYPNPYLSPFDELQRFKTHPHIAPLLDGGKRISYGARALNEGGFQALPKLSFPGGLLTGCSAGFLNVAKIKGTHLAMKSGIVAAETVYQLLEGDDSANYDKAIQQSWIWPELKKIRNIRPGFRKGLWFGLAYAALDTYLFRGHAPWTMQHHPDHESLRIKSQCASIDYPKPDGKLTFDKLSSVFLSNVYHEENQPCHLIMKDPSIPIEHNLAKFDAPETRYCPAGVYEIVSENENKRLQINQQNCIHCKTCDIKDPQQNILWTTPEGGGGPNYAEM